MINVSNEFKELMEQYTDFKENAVITLANGTVLNLSESDFTVSNNSVSDGAGANAVPLGVAVGRSVQVEIANPDDELSSYDFFGAKIRLFLTFQLSDSVETVELGRFTVVTPETYGTTVIITASDDMYKANKSYSSDISFPASAGVVLRDSCSTCGISVLTTSFNNDDFVINEKPSSDYTHRQIIAYVAMIAAGNARINRQGYLEILSYDLNFDTKPYHELKNWKNLKTDTSDIVITGIQASYTEETENEDGSVTSEEITVLEGEEGYVLSIENPLISGKEQEALSVIGDALIGIPFRKFEGDHVAYPLAEFMDLAKITDWKGNTYNTFLTDINFVFFGLTTMKNSAESGIRNGNRYYSDGNQTLIEAKKLVEREKTDREVAMEKLAAQLADGSGMYITSEHQSDGSSVYYMHNKPSLSESNIIWKLTSEAFGISTDGGKTYPYGFNIYGETLTRILYAEGINADYVIIGSKKVGDVISESEQSAKNYSDNKLADYANTVTENIENIQSQVDGQIETFYYDYEPTLQNVPASGWTTTTERKKHEGDLFYWKSKGYAYRFFQDGATWKWQLVQDTDITQAMATAEKAQDTADGKRRVFVVTPQPPYDIGDLWTNGTDILTCAVARAQGSSYVSSDWQKLNTYADETYTIYNVDVVYALSSSATVAPTSGWQTTAPAWQSGKYMWQKTVTTYGDNSTSESEPTCIQGAAGKDGASGVDGAKGVGVSSIVEQYYKSTSATSLSGGSWSTTYPGWENGKYIWTRSVIKYTDNTSTTTTAVCVTGQKGDNGSDGVGIKTVTNKYAVSSSNTTAPTSWYESVQTMTTSNKYLWNYEIITYTNGTTSETEKRVIGVYGNTGATGATGASGKGISSIAEYYLASASSSGVTISTSGWTTTPQSTTTTKKYLWNYEIITYTDSTKYTSTPVIIGTHGATGAAGADGRGVSSTEITYQVSTSGTTVPTGTWSTSIPTVAAGRYLWTRTVITYTDSTTSTLYSVGRNGTNGTNGAAGADGKGISTITEYYLATSASSGVTTSTSGWTTTIQSITTTKKYLWNYEVIAYTDGTSTTAAPKIIGVYGNTGATGATGAAGADGKGISSITNYYLATSSSSGVTTSTSGWTTSVQTISTSKKYLWNYEVIKYTDGTSTTTTPAIIGAYGNTGATGAAGADGKDGMMLYATCTTAASTAAKVATITPTTTFVLYTGASVTIKFTYANTAASPTLNINGTGAKSIFVYGAALTASSPYNWSANSTVTFIYDGTRWVMADNSAMKAAANWCYKNNMTYIDGSKLYTGTVTADALAVNSVTAEKISVSDLSALNAKIGGFTIGSTAIYSSANAFGTTADNIYIGSSGISLGKTFKVTKAGALTASSGTIGGWSLTSTLFEKYSAYTTGTAADNVYRAFIYAPASPAASTIAFGIDWYSYDGSALSTVTRKWYVRYDGYIYAVAGGRIGGWTIGTGTSGAIYNGCSSMTSATAGTYIGTSGIRQYASASAYVNIQNGIVTAVGAVISGSITASSGKIGGFTIGSTSIYTSADAFGTTANNVYIGTAGISLGTTFKVTAAGALTATSGRIGDWVIGATYLASNNDMTKGTAGTQYQSGMRSYAHSNADTGAAFYIMAREYDGSAYGSWATKFRVRYNGELYAVAGGQIGGWLISNGTSGAIYKGCTSMTSTTAGTYIGTNGIRQYKSASAYVNIQNGVLTAQGAVIDGAIAASALTLKNLGFTTFEYGATGNTNTQRGSEYLTISTTSSTSGLEHTDVQWSGGYLYIDSYIEGETKKTSYFSPYGVYLHGNFGVLDNYVTMTGYFEATYANEMAFTAYHSTSGYGVSMGVGSGGYNRGLYDRTKNSWIAYRNQAGNTVIPGNVNAAGHIQGGSVDITPSAANTPTGKAVTFSTKFGGTPVVVASAKTTVPGTAVTGVGTSGASASGFTVYVTRGSTTTTGVSWIAMYNAAA